MDEEERVLASFCDDGETLQETWAVDAADRGWARRPPQTGGTVTVGLTDHRLLWYDGDLGSAALAAVERVDRDRVTHRKAPRIVRLGSAAMFGGLVTTLLVAWLSAVPLPVALLPVVVGVVAFGGTLAIARARGLSGRRMVRHRLQLDESGERVTIWGEADALAAIADAVEADVTGGGSADRAP